MEGFNSDRFTTIEGWVKKENENPQPVFWVEKPKLFNGEDMPNEDEYTDLLLYLPPIGEFEASHYMVANKLNYPNKSEIVTGFVNQEAEVKRNDWKEQMIRVMSSLHMIFKEDESGTPFLEDDNVTYDRSKVKMGLSPGWDIVKWRVNIEESIDEPNGAFIDTITWEKYGVKQVISKHGWRIY